MKKIGIAATIVMAMYLHDSLKPLAWLLPSFSAVEDCVDTLGRFESVPIQRHPKHRRLW